MTNRGLGFQKVSGRRLVNWFTSFYSAQMIETSLGCGLEVHSMEGEDKFYTFGAKASSKSKSFK